METYGIICLRRRKDIWEGLMMMRLVSYAYSVFINHSYTWPHKHDEQIELLRKLFSNMTAREKGYIASLNFRNMWFLRWLTDPVVTPQIHHRQKAYENKLELFNNRFVEGNEREKISIAISGSANISEIDLYEFPKGHQAAGESRLESALREFEEEIGLKRTQIRILMRDGSLAEPMTISDDQKCAKYRHDITGADDHKTYTTYFFIAYTTVPIQPSVKIDGTQYIEVADIKWINVDNQIAKKYSDILRSAKNRLESLFGFI